MIESFSNGVAASPASMWPSDNLRMISSVVNSSMIKVTFGYFFVKFCRNIGSKVGITVGMIPTLNSPPINPFC